MDIQTVTQQHTNELMAQPGVVGVGSGKDEAGKDVIQVLVVPGAAAQLPSTLDGYDVVLVETDPISAHVQQLP
jgi:hypothetical protein